MRSTYHSLNSLLLPGHANTTGFYLTMGHLSNLKIDIKQLRTTKNVEGKYIVPEELLYRLMSIDRVVNVLPECNIPRQIADEVAAEVVSGLRKIFSLLIINDAAELIMKFIPQDGLQNGSMDQKLPFQRRQLEEILTNLPPKTAECTITDLFDGQWEFIAPVFSGKLVARYLADDTRLPIVSDKKIGQGGFGVVHEIKLGEGYCSFGKLGGDAVRF